MFNQLASMEKALARLQANPGAGYSKTYSTVYGFRGLNENKHLPLLPNHDHTSMTPTHASDKETGPQRTRQSTSAGFD